MTTIQKYEIALEVLNDFKTVLKEFKIDKRREDMTLEEMAEMNEIEFLDLATKRVQTELLHVIEDMA